MTGRPTLLAVVLAFLVLACTSNASPDPAGTATAALPELDNGLKSLGSGSIDIPLDPGQVRDLDPLNMAINLGVTPPACADFVMSFTWQVKRPDPPGDAKVAFSGERMGGTFEVAPPASSGHATIGCALLQATNQSTVPIVVQLRFAVATSRR